MMLSADILSEKEISNARDNFNSDHCFSPLCSLKQALKKNVGKSFYQF